MSSLSPKPLLAFAMYIFLVSGWTAHAFSFNPTHLLEDQLLKVIDNEFLNSAENPDSLEWTEDYGLQPIDAYELDYAEKCELIQNTTNKKAIAACLYLLGKN